MARGSIRRRFFVAAMASSMITIVLFAAGALAFVYIDEVDMVMDDGDTFREEAVELVVNATLIVAPFLILTAFITATAMARRAARPIEDAIKAARETTANDLRRELPVPVDEGELRDLVVSLNELFVRLGDGFGALASFTADASHELRTPLAVMATELEVAMRHPRTPAEWNETARTNLDELRRMSSLVDGLLSFARAGADSPAQRVEIDLVESVDLVIAQLAGVAKQRGVTLVGPRGEVSGRVTANPMLVEVAIRNLISNAIAATKSGGRVEVGVELVGESFEVTVDDDGPGLGPSPEALFVPFRRGATATADSAVRGAGVGLGLAIARRVATSHGGALEPGVSRLGGARLVLTLPRASLN